MARRDFLTSVSDGLQSIIKDQVKAGFGSLRLTRKDKKTFARLFFKDGLIYGIEVSTYKPNIVTRIVTNEFISESNRTQVLNKFGKTLNDFGVVKFVVDYQLFPERPLATYIKDYFFDAFDDVFKWTEVSVEWKSNDKLTAGLTVAPTEPADLIKRLKERNDILVNNLATAWAVHPKEFLDLKFVRNFSYNEPDYTKQIILSLPENATLSIGEVAEYIGLPYFNAQVVVFELWNSGAVDILHPRGMQYSNRSDQEIRESTKHTSSVPVQSASPSPESAPMPNNQISHDIAEEEETFFPPLIEEIIEEHVDEEETYHYEEEEPVQLETEMPVVPDYNSQVNAELGGNDEDEDEYTYFDEDEDDTSLYSDIEIPQPETNNYTTPEEPENMPDNGGNLSALAQQMKNLIGELKGKISDAKNRISNHERTIASKTAQRRELVTRLKALDTEIANAKTQRSESIAELEALETEFNDFTQLLK